MKKLKFENLRMLSDRDLDIRVAKSLGWIVIETDDCNGEDNYWLSEDGQHVYLQAGQWEKALPFYSTDASDNWILLNMLNQKGIISICNGDGDSWDVDFHPYASLFGYSWNACQTQDDDSLFRSICLAFLMAVPENTIDILE